MTGVRPIASFANAAIYQSAGKVGHESAAAKYAAATESSNLSIESEKPYAEVRL